MRQILRLSVEKGGTKVWSPSFNVKIVLLSRATGSVSIDNLSAFDVIGSKGREIVGDATGDATGDQRLLIFSYQRKRGKLPVTTP